MGSLRSGAEENDPPKTRGRLIVLITILLLRTSSSMTKEINPSWKQLRQIPECLLKAQVLNALGIDPPDEGVAERFIVQEGVEEVFHNENGFIWFKDHRALYTSPDDLLRKIKLPKGTPTGDLFRQWLRRKGWVPKSERRVTEAQENTKVII